MSNYTKTTNFTAKDALLSGDPNKIIEGALFDTEYDAIETSIATKAELNGVNTEVFSVAAATSQDHAPSTLQVQGGSIAYSAMAGTDTYTGTLSPAPTTYTTGMRLYAKFTNANTSGSVTINLNSLGAKSVVFPNGSSLGAGDISAGMVATLMYDGTNFVILSVSNKGEVKVAQRNTILAGATNSDGTSNIISAGTGLTADLSATATAVRLAFAYGYDVNGMVDYVGSITADDADAFGTLPQTATNYLYIDRDISTGVLSGGFVKNIPPVSGPTYPSAYGAGQSYLHFDGADAATSVTDDGGRTWTFNGNAQLDTAQFKFGTASLLLDGTGDYLSASRQFYLSKGGIDGFLLDCFIRLNATGVAQTIFKSRTSAYGMQLNVSSSNVLQWYLSSDGSTANIANGTSGTTTLTTGQWYHVRAQWDGTTYKLYLDGVEELSVAGVAFYTNTAESPLIGYDGTTTYFNGWVDDFSWENRKVTHGTFTPPTVARGGLASDQEHWFDTNTGKMKYWNRATAAWVEVQRVFVGEAVTGASTVSSVVNYPLHNNSIDKTRASAWVNFNGTNTVYIRAALNVSSITDNGVGDYTVNFTDALTDTNYVVSGVVSGPASIVTTKDDITPRTTSLFRIRTADSTFNLIDTGIVQVSVSGN